MYRSLGYYALAIMLMICAIRLYNKEELTKTNPILTNSNPINTITPQAAKPVIAVTPLIPVTSVVIPQESTLNNFNTTSAYENTANTYENEDYSTPRECGKNDIEDVKAKLINETSLDELKAKGWHTPQKADYAPEYYTGIKRDMKNVIEADFDNNGLKDKAVLMMRKNPDPSANILDSTEHCIFIALKQDSGINKIFKITAGEGKQIDSGLNLQKAEKIELIDCNITFKHPAIDFSHYDSCGGQIIFWDKKKFRCVYTGC